MCDLFEGKTVCVLISENIIEDRVLCKNILCLGDELYLINNPKLQRFPYSYMSPKKMITMELKKHKENLSFVDILVLLQIEDYEEIFERKWRYLGNNKWICSVALGIAEGRKLFCLPWMYTSVMAYQMYRNNKIFQAIKKIGGNIIFPVESWISDYNLKKEDFCVRYVDEFCS